MTPEDQHRLAEAFAYAVGLHADQLRKGTDIPYVSHLMAVAGLVLEHGGTIDQAIAALLHDGPEDRGGEATLEEIRELFGEEVARIVEECSDTFEEPKPPWEERKRAYIEHLREEASDETLLVSLADKTHNLTSILRDHETHGEALWERFRADREQTLGYYEALLAVYEERMPAGAGADERAAETAAATEPLLRQFRRLVRRFQQL